jgi:hypothetical protein
MKLVISSVPGNTSPNWELPNSSRIFKISSDMNDKEKAAAEKTIRFSLNISEPGETIKLNLQGIINYEFSKGLILTTDYPLEKGHIVRFSEKIKGHQIGMVKRVLVYGKTYMSQIYFK